MTGPKLNEASMVAGERTGVKASAMYLRVSASKARVVLNLIRGLPVKNADEVLQFSDREVSNDIRKVLASAVANAQHNHEQDPEELFVKACFADEGPTLKRFTPRARGRGNRINKRTCHITIVLGRLDDARLEVVQAREAKRAAQLRDGETDTTESLPAGAAAPNEDGSAPEGFEIKGNADSMLYHVPGTPFYDRTVPEVWFASEEAAEAAGFSLPPSQQEDDES